MEEILDYLQEASYGLAELRASVACGCVEGEQIEGFVSNVRRMLNETAAELTLIEASLASPAA